MLSPQVRENIIAWNRHKARLAAEATPPNWRDHRRFLMNVKKLEGEVL